MKEIKKILFVMPSLKTGGIQSAFLNLLNELEGEAFNIDVLCFDDDDNNKLPPFVNKLSSNKFLRMLTVEQKKIKEESFMLGVFRLLSGFVVKLFGQKYVYSLLLKTYKKLSGYDVAISYAQSANSSLYGGFNEFVLYRVDAKKKISFIHCDYEQSGINTAYSREIYNQFDKIAAVSESVKNKVVSCCSELSDKVCVVYNCHKFNYIKNLSEINPVIYPENRLNFITVARISNEKGHSRMLEMFKVLSDEGYDFCWHIVGGGNSKVCEDFKTKIEKYGLTDKVFFYSEQPNPYRYMKNADILLVPSLHEAAPVVYTEAFTLGLPVISTNTLSAKEFVEKRKFGAVCDNSADGLYSILRKILSEPQIIDNFKDNIHSFKPDNAVAKKQFIEMIYDENS